MGLDMYLNGDKYLLTDWDDESKNQKEDGFRVKTKTLELGYWRKHPNLHGYIVQTFAGGKDECQEIDLSDEDIEKIIDAVEKDALPHTTGFFFGVSTAEDKQPTLEILRNALRWMRTREEKVIRSVIYRASW